jgi:hypothetical protein
MIRVYTTDEPISAMITRYSTLQQCFITSAERSLIVSMTKASVVDALTF